MTDREMIVAAIERLYPVPPNRAYDERAGLMHARNIEFIHARLLTPPYRRYDDDGKCDIEIYAQPRSNDNALITFYFDEDGAIIKMRGQE